MDWPPPCGERSLAGVDGRVGLWPYRGTVRRLIVQAKDMPHGAQAWALRRAALCAWQQMRVAQAKSRSTTWCVAPPSRKRTLADWYLPSFVARKLAAAEGAPFRQLLRRRAQRLDQADLSGVERRANLKGQFVWRQRSRVPQQVLLFDDVSTTGATLQEAARALRVAGVEEVRAVCLAVVD